MSRATPVPLSEDELEQLKYPTGKLSYEQHYSDTIRENLITRIERLPADLRAVTISLQAVELSYRYRPDAWNIRQIIHHVSDSHINAYIRLKLTLTEDNPTIKPYNENKWAVTTDALQDNLELSLSITENIHKKLVLLLRNMKEADFERTYFHPEMKRNVPLTHLLSMYAWHGHHHLAQIKVAREKKF